MIHKTVYRLDKYVVTEYGNGQLWWVTHVALGEQRGGRCFICSNILIIGEWSGEEDGYLIGEFYEQLEKLPAWDKTRYYCSVSDLLDAGTGQNMTNALLEKRLSVLNMTRAELKPVTGREPGDFRLGPYWITVSGKDIFWHAYGELNRIRVGQCFIESDLLFLGDQSQDKEAYYKQEFFKKLHLLSPWDRTIAWSRIQALKVCRQDTQKERPGIGVKWSEQSVDETHTAQRLDHYKAALKRQLMSGLAGLKTAWSSVFAGKVWLKYLVMLAAAALLLALAMTFHAAKKMFHWAKERHHKHGDHERR